MLIESHIRRQQNVLRKKLKYLQKKKTRDNGTAYPKLGQSRYNQDSWNYNLSVVAFIFNPHSYHCNANNKTKIRYYSHSAHYMTKSGILLKIIVHLLDDSHLLSLSSCN